MRRRRPGWLPRGVPAPPPPQPPWVRCAAGYIGLKTPKYVATFTNTFSGRASMQLSAGTAGFAASPPAVTAAAARSLDHTEGCSAEVELGLKLSFRAWLYLGFKDLLVPTAARGSSIQVVSGGVQVLQQLSALTSTPLLSVGPSVTFAYRALAAAGGAGAGDCDVCAASAAQPLVRLEHRPAIKLELGAQLEGFPKAWAESLLGPG